MKRLKFRVTATRERRWWLLRVAELDVMTQARRLSDAESTARDLIATWLDTEAEGFDVEISPAAGDDDLDALVARTLAARATSERASRRANALTDEVIRQLLDRGVPMRDVGEIFGISHQRVAQLARR